MNVLLAVTGGIAAYKTPELVRQLRRDGHEVRCLVTPTGAEMVAEKALMVVSGHPVACGLWGEDGEIPHITLARWADAFLVAPATANALAKCALGLADDLLTTCHVALEPSVKVFFAPAMNTVMWEKPVVREHVAALRGAGATIVEPVPGDLACGESGAGAMAEPEAIVAALRGG